MGEAYRFYGPVKNKFEFCLSFLLISYFQILVNFFEVLQILDKTLPDAWHRCILWEWQDFFKDGRDFVTIFFCFESLF